MQAHMRRFREFGTIPGIYPNPPSSKPWAIAQAFCSKIGRFRTLRNSRQLSTNNPESSWKSICKPIGGLSGSLQRFPALTQIRHLKGPFTHAIFDAISDAISRTKSALPYPARMPFSRSIAWIGKKVMTYYLKVSFFPIPANLAVLRRSDTRLKTRAG